MYMPRSMPRGIPYTLVYRVVGKVVDVMRARVHMGFCSCQNEHRSPNSHSGRRGGLENVTDTAFGELLAYNKVTRVFKESTCNYKN